MFTIWNKMTVFINTSLIYLHAFIDISFDYWSIVKSQTESAIINDVLNKGRLSCNGYKFLTRDTCF